MKTKWPTGVVIELELGICPVNIPTKFGRDPAKRGGDVRTAILAAILKTKWPTRVVIELGLDICPVDIPIKFEVDPTKNVQVIARTRYWRRPF